MQNWKRYVCFSPLFSKKKIDLKTLKRVFHRISKHLDVHQKYFTPRNLATGPSLGAGHSQAGEKAFEQPGPGKF